MIAAAAYPERREAVELQRELRASLHLTSTVRYCHDCMAYHVVANARDRFSKQQAKIIDLLVQGRADQEIATALGCSVFWVRKQVHTIRDRLYARSRTQVAVFALVLGMVDPRAYVPAVEHHQP